MATVRVEPKLHATLRALADAEQRPIGHVIEDAIDRYTQDQCWRAMHGGFARLRTDPVAWNEYEAEAALWDSASGDGLEDEAPYSSDEEVGDEVAASATHG